MLMTEEGYHDCCFLVCLLDERCWDQVDSVASGYFAGMKKYCRRETEQYCILLGGSRLSW